MASSRENYGNYDVQDESRNCGVEPNGKDRLRGDSHQNEDRRPAPSAPSADEKREQVRSRDDHHHHHHHGRRKSEKRKSDELSSSSSKRRVDEEDDENGGSRRSKISTQKKLKPDPSAASTHHNKAVMPIKINLKPKPEAKSLAPVAPGVRTISSSKKPPGGVAAAFGDDSESEEEKMPLEAKMRMRNRGRDTPTSAGPNSYFKTSQGFCDRRGIINKQLGGEET